MGARHPHQWVVRTAAVGSNVHATSIILPGLAPDCHWNTLLLSLMFLTCSVDVGKSPDIPYVYVTYDGLVRNYKPIQVVTACTLNIYNFPFDVQKCSLTFQSWLHTGKTSSTFTLNFWLKSRNSSSQKISKMGQERRSNYLNNSNYLMLCFFKLLPLENNILLSLQLFL